MLDITTEMKNLTNPVHVKFTIIDRICFTITREKINTFKCQIILYYSKAAR